MISLTILLIVLFSPLLGEDFSCPSLSKLRLSIEKEPYVSLNFNQYTHSEIFESVDSLVGTLKADHNGRFRLSLYDNIGLFQELVCDGVSYWSYSVVNNQVILSDVTELNHWNPLTLLYDKDAVYNCVDEKLTGEQGASTTFKMVARDSTSSPQVFFLDVTSCEYTPQAIKYFDDNNSRIEIWISDFVRLERLPDSVFQFYPPIGVEVIELP